MKYNIYERDPDYNLKSIMKTSMNRTQCYRVFLVMLLSTYDDLFLYVL